MAKKKNLDYIEQQRKEKLEREHKMINGVDHKICNKHNIFFPNEDPWFPATLEYFYHNNKNKTDGLHPECKRCGVAKADQWIKDNPDKFKESYKRYMKTDNWKAYKKENYIKSKDKMSEWRHNNPEKCKEYNIYKTLHKKHDITTKEWKACKEYFNNQCAYCGFPLEKHYHTYAKKLILFDFCKDHKDNNGSNDLSNCIPACKSCNSKKWEYPFEEWYNETNIVYNEERFDKIMKWLNEDYKLYIKEKVLFE